MKTVFKRILVVAMMLGTLTGYANVVTEVTSTFTTIKKGDLVSVYDAQGKIVYSDRVEYTGNLKTLFDFSNLKNGIYTIEVNKDFEIDVNKIEVNNKIVKFIDQYKKTIHKPVFRKERSKVLISKLALDSSEMVVEIYFGNELIHSEKATGKGIINRIYQLDEKERGDYTTIIRANGRTYIENFRI